MTRIFNHGFTTMRDGHGFGLHSGALAAKEMGGRLSAHSDGPGKRRPPSPWNCPCNRRNSRQKIRRHCYDYGMSRAGENLMNEFNNAFGC